MNLMRFLPLGLFAGLAVLLAVGLYLGDPKEIPSVFIDEPAPAISLPPIPGYRDDLPPLDNALLASGEVSLVNIFASWCAPCRIEHPILMEWAKTQDVPIYGFNYKDAPADARAFLEELGDPYALVGSDPNGRAGIDWGVYGVPETFVIDGEGRVVYKHVGPLDAVALRTLIQPAVEEARARVQQP